MASAITAGFTLLAVDATGPHSAAQGLATSLTAMGLIVLVVWIVRAIARPRRITLQNRPGRPSSLGLPQMAGVFLAWAVLGAAAHGLAVQLAPTEGDLQAHTKTAIVASAAFSMMLVPVLLLIAHFTFRHGIFRGLGLSGRRWLWDIFRGALAMLAAFPLCMFTLAAAKALVPERNQQTHEVLLFLGRPETGWSWRLAAIVMAGLLAPIAEEILYRGFVQSALVRRFKSRWLTIVLASLLFAIVHVQIVESAPVGKAGGAGSNAHAAATRTATAGDSPGAPGQGMSQEEGRGAPAARAVGLENVAPLFVLALVLGYNYERTGRLLPCIVMHSLFNLSNLAMVSLS